MIAKEKFDKKELFEARVRFEFEVPSKYNNCFDPANQTLKWFLQEINATETFFISSR